MTRLVVTASASTDESTILQYLRMNAGPRTAGRFRDLFAGLYDRLLLFPERGPRRTVLGPDVRIGLVPPFVIYDYRADADTVVILRIIHGRRNIARTLPAAIR